jgi:hypothetical protein
MLLSHGLEVFPEVVGQAIICCGCQEPLPDTASICIQHVRDNPEKPGSQQLLQFLVCTVCTLQRVEHYGSA